MQYTDSPALSRDWANSTVASRYSNPIISSGSTGKFCQEAPMTRPLQVHGILTSKNTSTSGPELAPHRGGQGETGHLSSATGIWAGTFMFSVNPAPKGSYTMGMRSSTPGPNQTPSPQYTQGLSVALDPSWVSLGTSWPSVPAILLLSRLLDSFLCCCCCCGFGFELYWRRRVASVMGRALCTHSRQIV